MYNGEIDVAVESKMNSTSSFQMNLLYSIKQEIQSTNWCKHIWHNITNINETQGEVTINKQHSIFHSNIRTIIQHNQE